MCGITAAIGDLADSAELIASMTRALTHRGPDGCGTFVAPHVALGHRRLAVIDLSDRAAQPMASDDGKVVIVYNGEVYNFQALRAELESKGHVFRSRGDTEVVLRLYEELGDACVEKLNGMFAFVIWDGRRGRALVARDRFGQKPLFYSESGGVLYVASEIKALLQAPGISRELSLPAVDAYLTSNWIPAPLSIYCDIRRLEPGELLVKERGAPSARRRYTPPRPAATELGYDDALNRVGELLDHAVERQLVSDVPVGLFLSGGIDSTLVLSRAARSLQRGFDVFTVAFSELDRSELPFAERAAKRVGATLHQVMVGPTDFQSPEAIVSAFDEPFADVATLAVAKLSAQARKLVTVVLTGDGGDELFGGYEVHVAAAYANQLGSTAGGIRRGLARLSEALPETAGYRRLSRFVKRGLSLAADDWQGVARRLRANLQPDERRSLLSPDALRDLGGSDPFDYLLPRAPSDPGTLFDPLHDRMLGDLFLHKTDITSMASGLECRSPFLDVPLSEFARSLPTKFLVRGLSGKRVLRDLVSRELDDGLARRRKTGFSPPLDGWLRGTLTHLLDDYLGDQHRPVFDLVSYSDVARRVREHRAGTHNHRRVLWSVMLLEAWLESSRRSAAHPSGVPASSISA